MEKNTTYIKLKEQITPEYVNQLRDWIITNAKNYFTDKKYDATHWTDFDFFGVRGSKRKLDRLHLVMPEEVLLIDRKHKDEHWYVICQVFEDERYANNKRCIHIAPVVKVNEIKYGDWRNGYFLLPNLTAPDGE